MPKSVMVIPDTPIIRIVRKGQALTPVDLSLHQQNWVFGQQFKSAAPNDRDLVTVAVNGSLQTDFGPAMRRAAALAGKGGMVILFTGHGCRAACVGGTCQFGPASSSFGFETLPESAATKTKKIDTEVLKFLEIAERQGTGWAPKAQRRPGSTTVTRESQGKIDALVPKWEALDVMQQAFTTAGIDRLILLTCNVGTFSQECQTLANLLRTTVVAYREKIATSEFTPPFDEPPNMAIRPVQCWCTSPPHTRDNPAADPLTSAIRTPHNKAVDQWILANWKRHPYFSQLPGGPVVECTPGGQPKNFP